MLPGTKTDRQPVVPLVSVIIPVHNSEAFIAAAIQSAIDQSWPNKEVIVVDDGSSDKSLETARRFESEQVQVYTQRNQGACATRNNGFSYTKGSFIQYLDGDDVLSAGKIVQQMELLSQYPAGYIASCPWGRFEHEPAEAAFIPEAVWKDYGPVDWLTTAWMGGGMMQTACWLTPRDLIEQAGPWNESFKRNPNDDGEFFCRVLLKSRGIRFCGGAEVYYRNHSGERVSRVSNREAVESLLNTAISYEAHILPIDSSPRVVRALIHQYASFMYRYYNLFPDLGLQAEQRIRKLGATQLPAVGGKYFKKGAELIGFKNMLRLRSMFKNY